jgi:activating signal cointegrator complex subunit 3
LIASLTDNDQSCASLAWGINLPAHSVVIKGTEVYNPEKGGVTDISILDVQQIFGRAGRPQFDSSGEATLVTTHDAFSRYMNKLVTLVPIESNFIKQLADHLNAEIVGGTVTDVREAVEWLSYTYLYIRMVKNPLAYGISADEMADDIMLRGRCEKLITDSARELNANKMINFDPNVGNFSVADRGRVAAHFYIQTESIASFNELLSLKPYPSDADLLRTICCAAEFSNMKIRQDEIQELESFRAKIPMQVQGAGADETGQSIVAGASDKVFILMQVFISRQTIRSFTLQSDTNYISANAARVARALFEICLKQSLALQALKFLRFAKSIESQIWWFQTPLRQFGNDIKEHIYQALERRGRGNDLLASALDLLDMQPGEVGELCAWPKGGGKIQEFVRMLPLLEVSFSVKPVTTSIVNCFIELTPVFEWSTRWHSGAQSFYIWVADETGNRIYHHEQLLFFRRTFPEPVVLEVTVPVFEPMPSQYIIQVISDSWVGVEMVETLPFKNIKLPNEKNVETSLLDLSPLPVTALQDPHYEQLYSHLDVFNPVSKSIKFHLFKPYETSTYFAANRFKRNFFMFCIIQIPQYFLARQREVAKL